MKEKLTLLAHHIPYIIARRHFLHDYDDWLDLVREQHGEKACLRTKSGVESIFENSERLRIIITPPDSFCIPDLSSVCNDCVNLGVATYQIPENAFDFERRERYRDYRINRTKKDADYKTMRRLCSSLDEIMFLFYYNLEPKECDFGFLMEKIEEFSKKCPDTFSPSQLSHAPPKVREQFPTIKRFVDSGLYGKFMCRVVDEAVREEKITNEELTVLKKDYPELFATAGSDQAYYAVLDVLDEKFNSQ